MNSVTSNAVYNSFINYTGNVSVQISALSYENTLFQFPAELPNNKYVAMFDTNSTGSILVTVLSKQKTGMAINIRNLNDANLPVVVNWSILCKR